MLTKSDLHNIIKIGGADNIENIVIKDIIESFKTKDYINRNAPLYWDEVRKILGNDIQLIDLFKGLVILEKELNWSGGSVAGAIWVYKLIKNANLDNDFRIADFGLQKTNNPYVPFGSLYYGKRNSKEYFLDQEKRNQERAIRVERYEKFQNRVTGRKENRKAAIAELRKLSFDQRGQIIIELMKKYKNSSIIEKLQLIASDKKYPPEYYPAKWVELDANEIQQLPNELRNNLFDKLSTNTRGEWKRFGEKLRKFVDGF